MPYLFKCGFCKAQREMQYRSKIVIWLSNNEVISDSICVTCCYKMINVFKLPTLTNSKKQQILTQFGVDLKNVI